LNQTINDIQSPFLLFFGRKRQFLTSPLQVVSYFILNHGHHRILFRELLENGPVNGFFVLVIDQATEEITQNLSDNLPNPIAGVCQITTSSCLVGYRKRPPGFTQRNDIMGIAGKGFASSNCVLKGSASLSHPFLFIGTVPRNPGNGDE
jgi:hypothetical protein